MRDVALLHVRAIEDDAAANKRFLVAAGHFNGEMLVNIIRKSFPEYNSLLPSHDG